MLKKLTEKFRGQISYSNRMKKFKSFIDLIQPTSKTTILDVGFSSEECNLQGNNIAYNYLEVNYPYPQNITALGIEDPQELAKKHPDVKYVQYDGDIFPFEDKVFDVCWSNAVLEHVGNKEKKKLFLQEIKRVSKVAFVTTPNKYFPFEVHTNAFLLHFLLPKKYFNKYLIFIGKKWAAGDYMELLSLKDIKTLLDSAGIKEYRIIENKLWGLTLDFVMIFGDYNQN